MYVIMCVSYTKHHQNRLAHWITAKSLICDHDLRALHKHTIPQKFPWQMATYRHVEWCRDAVTHCIPNTMNMDGLLWFSMQYPVKSPTAASLPH